MFPTQALATAVANSVAAKRSNATAADGPAKNSAPSPRTHGGGVNNPPSATPAATASSASPTKSPGSINKANNKRPSNYPLTNIFEPTANDILFGRGGGTNHHPGNKLYRQWVDAKKEEYSQSPRMKKPLVAMGIVKDWRALDPPGRFLQQDAKTRLWNDVGDNKAREKTSQALREKPWGKKSIKSEKSNMGVQEEAVVQNDESPASTKSDTPAKFALDGALQQGTLQEMIQKDIEEWWNKRKVELKDTRKPEEKVLPKGHARRKTSVKKEDAVVQSKTADPPQPQQKPQPQHQHESKPKRSTPSKRSKTKKISQPTNTLKNIRPPNNKRKIDWEDDYCLEYAELVYRAAVRTAEEKGLVTSEKKRKLQHKFYRGREY